MRALGLEPGGVIAAVLPNGVEMFELYLAALQAGWYLVPINHHLIGPEVAYILRDSDATVLVGHERFAEVCAESATLAAMPERARLGVGTIEGFSSFAEMREGQPTSFPPTGPWVT